MVALSPVTIAGAGSGAVDWSAYPATHQVKLANYSSFALRVTVAGRDRWLDLQTADVFEVAGSSGLIYIATAAVTPAAPGTLLITLADVPGERIPGIYPVHLR